MDTQQQLQNNLIPKTFNKYQIPPDPDLALLHFNASKIGRPFKNSEKSKTCPCCSKTIKEDFNLWKDGKNIKSYGNTIPLYFQFMNFMLGYFVILFLSSLYIIIAEIQLSYELKKQKNKAPTGFKIFYLLYDLGVDFYTEMYKITSNENHPSHKKMERIYVNNLSIEIFTAYVLILFSTYYQYSVEKLIKRKKDKMKINASDFTVMIGNVSESHSLKDIKVFVERVSSEAGLPCPRIVKAVRGSLKGNIKILKNEIEEIENEINSIRQCLEKNKEQITNKGLNTAEKMIENHRKKISKLDKEVFKIVKKDLNMESNQDHCVFFLTLATTIERDWLLSCKKPVKHWIIRLCKKKKGFKILTSPSPDDVNWDQIGYSTGQRKASSFFRVVCLVLSVPIVTIIIFWIEFSEELMKNIKYKNFIYKKAGVSIFPLITILITSVYLKIFSYFGRNNKNLKKSKQLAITSEIKMNIFILTKFISFFALII